MKMNSVLSIWIKSILIESVLFCAGGLDLSISKSITMALYEFLYIDCGIAGILHPKMGVLPKTSMLQYLKR